MAPQIAAMEAIKRSFESWYFWFPMLVYGFLGALPTYNRVWYESDKMSDRFRATFFDTQDTFDFIVVGGGSGGSVVANRLSLNNTVLLLEAGGEENPWFSVPIMSFQMLNYYMYDWMYRTVPQRWSSGALVDNVSGWSAGRTLGGTSNLNFLIYLRGHTKDYEAIYNLTGDPEWSYDGVLPEFKSIENYIGQWDDEKMHGKKGEMTLQLPPYLGMAEHFVKAGQELGYPNTDLNGRFKEGFSLVYYPQVKGRRHSSYKSFIEPVRKRSNLYIYKFSQVSKVLFNENNEAIGVEYERHGVRKVAFARKEVVLSAGAVGSSKILMLSGIGPRKELAKLGIPVRSDRPVGRNLQDHISTYLGPFFVNKTLSMNFDRDVTAKSFMDFVHEGVGELTSSGCSASAFVSSPIAKRAGEGDWPDIQFIFLGNGVYTKMSKDMSHGFHVKPEIMEKYLKNDIGKDSFQIIVSMARPRARGYMTLGGKSHLDDMIIDPRYLDNEHDLSVLVEGVKMAVHLVENTTTFSKMGGRFTDTVFPGCEGIPFKTDAYWRCFVYQYSITLHHIVGPCSMGKSDSKDAVVDTRLRVLGVKRLRVADASVVPIVPISNTNAAATMVGEKAAKFILKDWGMYRGKSYTHQNEIRKRHATNTN